MDLAFTDLQDELRAQARGFLEATPEPSWEALGRIRRRIGLTMLIIALLVIALILGQSVGFGVARPS